MTRSAIIVLLTTLLAGCSSGDPTPWGQAWGRSVSKVKTDSIYAPGPSGGGERFNRPYLRDEYGRYVHLQGVNLSGSNKFPDGERFPNAQFPYADWPLSYVGKPFPREAADKILGHLQDIGFNAVRFLISWEALQPEGPDKFDEEYIKYVDEMVARAAAYGIYVLLDMHQDIFSRHLFVLFNGHPKDADGVEFLRGSLEAQVLSLVPPYDDWVRGDGAPRWVVETCLPEKNLASPAWGVPRIAYNLGPDEMLNLAGLLGKFLPPGTGTGNLEWLTTFVSSLPKPEDLPPEFQPYDIRQSGDFLPFTFWGLNGALSLDAQRCFACLFAGDKVTPGRMIGDKSVKDFLQDQYTAAWVRVAEAVSDNPNVIGYDIMNEPVGAFITYAAVALFFQTGAHSAVQELITTILGEDTGADLYELLVGLKMLPGDDSDETKELWGFDGVDAGAVLDLNYGFDQKYLQPLYEKVAGAILEVDHSAVIWFEPSMGLSMLTGDSPQWQINMTKPEGVQHAVFAPHWYPDIYPFVGFNQAPREFGPEEWKYRDFLPNIEKIVEKAEFSLSGVPVVFGEFGTYFNFNGIEDSIESEYEISAQILDAYYRAFEDLGLSRMQWCYSPENTFGDGEGWNKEDFSVVDGQLQPRAWQSWMRPYARTTSGVLVQSRFRSPLEAKDPDKGEPLPVNEYYLQMEGKETDAPTEIFVPRPQYPDGFYVWLSDGSAWFDAPRQILYWLPLDDAPGAVHDLRILPHRAWADVHGWDYFFDGANVIDKSGGVL